MSKRQWIQPHEKSQSTKNYKSESKIKMDKPRKLHAFWLRASHPLPLCSRSLYQYNQRAHHWLTRRYVSLYWSLYRVLWRLWDAKICWPHLRSAVRWKLVTWHWMLVICGTCFKRGARSQFGSWLSYKRWIITLMRKLAFWATTESIIKSRKM